MKKSFPILEFDPERRTALSPANIVKPMAIPEYAVLSFFNDAIHKLNQQGQLRQLKKLKSELGSHIVYEMAVRGHTLALLHPGVGAPLAVALFEEIIALGCRKFIVCGGAGVLDEQLAMGHLLIPTAAVRDEGTSYHYLPPAREVSADEDAVAAITRVLTEQEIGFTLTKTWTIDAIYRETPAKIALRKTEGCKTVEMEAAALFAVAQFRGVKVGQILYAGDDVSGTEWRSRGWVNQSDIRQQLIWLAAEACLNIK